MAEQEKDIVIGSVLCMERNKRVSLPVPWVYGFVWGNFRDAVPGVIKIITSMVIRLDYL